jgi:hypothetical protein
VRNAGLSSPTNRVLKIPSASEMETFLEERKEVGNKKTGVESVVVKMQYTTVIKVELISCSLNWRRKRGSQIGFRESGFGIEAVGLGFTPVVHLSVASLLRGAGFVSIATSDELRLMQGREEESSANSGIPALGQQGQPC